MKPSIENKTAQTSQSAVVMRCLGYLRPHWKLGGTLVINHGLTLGELVAFTTCVAQIATHVRYLGMVLPAISPRRLLPPTGSLKSWILSRWWRTIPITRS